MDFVVRQMEIGDYDPVWQLWESSNAITLSSAESRERIQNLLERNPGMSYVALVGDEIAGAVLCSQDGRIGFLTHLAVAGQQVHVWLAEFRDSPVRAADHAGDRGSARVLAQGRPSRPGKPGNDGPSLISR